MNKYLMEGLVLPFIMNFITNLLTEENWKIYGDKLLDLIEELAEKSETKLDDRILLPIVAQIRVLANIPDGDDSTQKK